VGSILLPVQWVSGVFPGGKMAGAWYWAPTPSNAEVKETVELYLYPPSGPSWTSLGWTSPFVSFLRLSGYFCVSLKVY